MKDKLIDIIQDENFIRIKVDDEIYFQRGSALAVLLIMEVVFLNNHWWEEKWPDGAKRTVGIFVNCNDLFAWGCADSEEVSFDEIEDLYKYWEKDNNHGADIWCIIKREELPQKPVYDSIQQGGIWDLEELKKKYNLSDNLYDKFIIGE